MRSISLAIVSLLMLALTAPAHADDKDTIDTGKGLTFSKPGGWVDAGKKKGAVAALKSSSDEKSGIEFRYAEISAAKSTSFFNSFHASLVGAGLEKKGKSESKTYGKLKGTLVEYTTSQKEGEGMRVFVFQFHRGNGAWLVVGMFDAGKRDAHLSDYEAMLTTVAWK